MSQKNKFKYISKLLGREIRNNDELKEYDIEVIKNALEKAWETRNFEIKLYWQRALYFWGFIALAFYAPFAILKLKQDIIADPILNKFFFITIFCILGSILSYGWYLANRGSKYWQENWEHWINTLEEYKYGNLYTTPFDLEDMKIGKLCAGKFSLSRINIVTSVLITIIWTLAAAFSAYNINFEHRYCCLLITLLIILLMSTWLRIKVE